VKKNAYRGELRRKEGERWCLEVLETKKMQLQNREETDERYKSKIRTGVNGRIPSYGKNPSKKKDTEGPEGGGDKSCSSLIRKGTEQEKQQRKESRRNKSGANKARITR